MIKAAVMTFLLAGGVASQAAETLFLEHARELEVFLENGRYVTYLTGEVSLKTPSGSIRCDSAVWIKGEEVKLWGNVLIDDDAYRLSSDSAFYSVATDQSYAWGKRVEIWSYTDSLYAVGTHAFYDRRRRYFRMFDRPVLYLNYPDSSKMIEIIADEIEYDAQRGYAEALDNVIISSNNFSSHSGCAVMQTESGDLDLFDNPTVRSGQSVISGKLIAISFEDDLIDRIDVTDSARAELNEPTDSLETDFDRSLLAGKRLIFAFEKGVLQEITCRGQAYSWYYPSDRGTLELHENSVSGDSITLHFFNKQISTVDVDGGAVGTYISGRYRRFDAGDSLSGSSDSLILTRVDTVDYNGSHIRYGLQDSLITLDRHATVKSGSMSLLAHKIDFYTNQRMVYAYSAAVSDDDTTVLSSLARQYQPNSIPVLLRDGDGEVAGDYLEYSIETEKGRIIRSKSDYDAGYYYGEKLFREQKKIFYVADGRYTTCDADEPHFHFHSSNMKLIEQDKLIARPVIFYIERLPLFILPYYVFPLQRGRHSGLLPFTFGKFQRGDRYVSNVGYYWAASQYLDYRGSIDYHEKNRTLTFRSRVNFNKRYVLDGYITGDYARETSYDATVADERRRTRWVARGVYNHKISPSFNIRAYGDFQSDKTYYNDFSLNIDDRLNRVTKSKINFSKKFGTSVSLSGEMSHTVNLDLEQRTDLAPSLGLSLPTVWLFGSGKRDDEGKMRQSWYNKITFRYSPSIVNFSSRKTNDSVITVPGANNTLDTTAAFTWRSRKKYTRINQNPALNLPTFKLFQYLIFNPRVSYRETWIKVHETDQSREAGIDPSTTYRTYSYDAGASLKTTLYGTLSPNIYGLVGFRHAVTPTISYRFSPELDRHPEVRAFAGGGAGSRKSSIVSLSLNQLFQGKTNTSGNERTYDLLSITNSLSHNFENEDRPWSDISTSFQSSVFRFLRFDGQMRHTVYDPLTDEVKFSSPILQSLSFNARFIFSGRNSIFDDAAVTGQLVDSTPPAPQTQSPAYAQSGGTGWNMSAIYSYTESGREAAFTKRSFLRFNLRFNLTSSTSITYTQSYDIGRKLTVNNSVNIVRTIHCWTGSLYWVPIGSNRGFGFKLFVTDLPEIKLDSSHDSFLKSLQN